MRRSAGRVRRWVDQVRAYRGAPSFVECEGCGDYDDFSVMAPLSDGRRVCWHCAERAGEFCIKRDGRLKEWRGDHLAYCVVCSGRRRD
jgi:hypothetical protein